MNIENKINIKIEELKNDILRLSYAICGDFTKLVVEVNEQFDLTYVKRTEDFPIYYNKDIVKKILLEIKEQKEFELKIYQNLLKDSLSNKE